MALVALFDTSSSKRLVTADKGNSQQVDQNKHGRNICPETSKANSRLVQAKGGFKGSHVLTQRKMKGKSKVLSRGFCFLGPRSRTEGISFLKQNLCDRTLEISPLSFVILT